MKRNDVFLLILLSAIWGASFLFMKVAAPVFGAISLILVRVAIAAVCLFPLLVKEGQWRVLLARKMDFFLLGVFNSALPFCLLTVATLSIEAGFTSVLNATTPLFAGVVAAIWMRKPLTFDQLLGLALGILGVAVLSWSQFSFKEGGNGWAILCGLGGGLSYGYAANFARQYMSDIHPFTLASGSMVTASIALAPLGALFWPDIDPPFKAWVWALALASLCTAFAYLIYFHLIKSSGAVAASTVTFIVPVFAILWGVWFLDESLSNRIIWGTIITLIGTSFTLGLVRIQMLKGSLTRR